MHSETAPNPAPADPGLPRNVKVLGGVSLLNDVASEMVFPLLPAFLLGVLGGGRFSLGIIEGFADSVSSLIKLFSGSWSDRLRQRRGFLLVGYAIALFARLATALVVAPWQLFITRTADRLGKGIRSAPRDAMLADSTPPAQRGRAFGFHRAMDHLGAAIGPVLATLFLLTWPGEFRLLFLLTLIPGVLVLVLLWFGLRETPRAEDRAPREPLRLSLAPFDRNFKRYLLALVVFTLGNSSDAFLLVRANELGVPIAWLPILWCVFHLAKSWGNHFFGKAADRLGARPLLLLGWLVYAAVYLAFAFASAAWHACALFLAYALFYSLAEPAEKTLVAQLTTGHKGLAYGWFNCAIGIATLPASVIFGALYEHLGALAAFGWGASLAGLAVFLLLSVRVRRESEASSVGKSE